MRPLIGSGFRRHAVTAGFLYFTAAALTIVLPGLARAACPYINNGAVCTGKFLNGLPADQRKACIQFCQQASQDVGGTGPGTSMGSSTQSSGSSSTATGSSGSGRQVASGLPHCLREFYDSATYNWLAIENTCSQAIYVTSQHKTGPSNKGGATLQPGAKSSMSESAGQVASHGGFAFAVCPAGFSPQGSDGRYWTNPDDTYTCAKQ